MIIVCTSLILTNHEGAGMLIYTSMKGIVASLASHDAGFIILGPPFGTTNGTQKLESNQGGHFYDFYGSEELNTFSFFNQ